MKAEKVNLTDFNRDYIMYKYTRVGMVVDVGNHGMIAAILKGLAFHPVHVDDDSYYLQNYRTDGKYWYKGAKRIEKVNNDMFALLFTVSQMLYNEKYKICD